VDLEDFVFCFEVGDWEFNFSINTSRSDQGWIQALYFVGSHDDFNFSMSIETVQLVQQLKHGSLNLFLASRVGIVSLGTDGIDFINENDGR
jgi:hypothetical protein